MDMMGQARKKHAAVHVGGGKKRAQGRDQVMRLWGNLYPCGEIYTLCGEIYTPCGEIYTPCGEIYTPCGEIYTPLWQVPKAAGGGRGSQGAAGSSSRSSRRAT